MSLTQATFSMIDGAWVNVHDFGAKGDSVTDDTAAIQAAVNYCTSLSNRKQTLYFPASNPACAYVITAPIVIPRPLNIVGNGQFSTIIYAKDFTSGQIVLDFNCDVADQVYYCGITNIKVVSNNSLAVGVRLKNVSYMAMKQVALSSLIKGVICDGTSCFSNYFEQLTLYGITSYGFEWASTFAGGGQWTFIGCTFNGSDGAYVRNGAGLDTLAFYNCNFEQCVTTDLSVEGTVRGLTLNTCRSEGLDGGTSFLISPVSPSSVGGLNVTGCFWTGDAGNANPINITGNVSNLNVTGNIVDYMGFQQFVYLNGAGQAGVISGNYCVNTPTTKVVSAPRAGVVTFANYNSSGAMTDYDGLLTKGYGSAPPVSGTYAVGSIIWNSAPASAGYIGWVCTVAGTPGTWKTFGLIS